MNPILAWLIKSILCSAVLFLYYHVFLKNKVFHHYNRFYLLALVAISIIAPFLHFAAAKETFVASLPFQLLNTTIMEDGELFEGGYLAQSPVLISATVIYKILYSIVILVFLGAFASSLLKIKRLFRRNEKLTIDDITIVKTDDAPGTPFSFFKLLFWNKTVDMNGAVGQKILQHELVHIREQHSFDKIFMNLIQSIFWINPIIWMIKKELFMIHEFLADEKSVSKGDTASFAAMILQASFPQGNFTSANHLSYSSIKRRIKMINQHQSPKVNYMSRIVALPVLAGLILLSSAYVQQSNVEGKKSASREGGEQVFVVKTDKNGGSLTIPSQDSPRAAYMGKKSSELITVLLDAGHGGTDYGAINLTNGTKEKDLALAIVEKIVSLNSNSNIKFILTRSGDETILPRERIANLKQKVDLLISIHIDSYPLKGGTNRSGLGIWIPKDDFKHAAGSKVFGSVITSSFIKNYGIPVGETLHQRKHGIAILEGVEVPSILIEAGQINNATDIKYLTSEQGQQTFAKNILDGIAAYMKLSSNAGIEVAPNQPNENIKVSAKMFNYEENSERKHIDKNVSADSATVSIKIVQRPTGLTGSSNFRIEGQVMKVEEDGSVTIERVSKFSNKGNLPEMTIFIDGVKADKASMEKLNPANIKTINIYKGEAAQQIHNEPSLDGVMSIITKTGSVNY